LLTLLGAHPIFHISRIRVNAITVSGSQHNGAADNQGNMAKEAEDRNASVEEWWDADKRKQQKYSLKKLRKNNVYKATLFSTPYTKK
jgi:hypothetical protein